MKTTLQRIKEYTDFKGITNQKFEKEIGFSNGAFSTQLKNNKTIGVDKLENILIKYSEINPEWLLTGHGEMLKSETKVMPIVQEQNYHLIPLYDGFMTASAISQDMPPQTDPVEMVNAGDWFRDATSAMRVHGDSMFPDYVSGSIVAMKEVQNKKLVVPGEDYLIETSEYRVLKRLQKSDLPEHWLLCSTNEDIWEHGSLKGRLIHEPFDIHIDDVSRICLILGSVKRNHSSRIVGLGA